MTGWKRAALAFVLAILAVSPMAAKEAASGPLETGGMGTAPWPPAATGFKDAPAAWQDLFFFAGTGRVEDVRSLLERGADVRAVDPQTGMTALMAAGSPEIAALLLDRGADLEAVDRDGAGVLHHAIAAERPVELVEFYLARGADPNLAAPGRGGETPVLAAGLWFFEGRDHATGAKLIRLLRENGADLDAADVRDGYALLHTAAVNGKPDLAELVLSLGANPDKRTADGKTALDYAKALQDAEMMRILKAHGAR